MTFSALPLSYCTNVHPAQTVQEVVDGLNEHSARAVRLAHGHMAAGLWLPAAVVDDLREEPALLEQIGQALWQNNLCCYTLNTFPYGDFHSDRVKEQVYIPDWASPDRVIYTERCAEILAKLLPPGADGSLSTVPLGGRMNPQDPDFMAVCFANLIRVAKFLAHLHESTGKHIRLAIEPEPMCHLSSTNQLTLPVFRHLMDLAETVGSGPLVREYVGLCFDVCHQAVEFEDVAESIRSIHDAGIRINKVHITNAVELPDPMTNAAGRQALMHYAEPRYLHQTSARMADGRILWRTDLQTKDLQTSGDDEFLRAEAWRVHFHVPVYAESLGPLRTTRSDLIRALQQVRELPYAPHLEVETYTWPVMPGDSDERPSDSESTLAHRIAAEINSAFAILEQLNSEQG
ncbi:MAG: metabolite traffic protein EboE [Planctomycetaceae bacterium]|nr:metabolite traffic protein EboE [Planctomycetaceae bacterium]